MRSMLLPLVLTLSCSSASPDETDPVDDYVPTCDPPDLTVCGNEAAMIRGTVRVAPGLADAGDLRGDLHIALTHLRLGEGETGGLHHTDIRIPDVDLSQGPVPFQLDMCEGSPMWSEENGEYNVLAILDRNANQDASNHVPDGGELAGRIGDLEVSCEGTSPCLDLVLDCVGPDCVRFDVPVGCTRAERDCDSAFVACN